jgi:hypothetical protein
LNNKEWVVFENDTGAPEKKSLKQASTRWLVKMFDGTSGCLGDVVNLCLAMVYHEQVEVQAEPTSDMWTQAFTRVQQALTGDQDSLDSLWLPDNMVMDAELDDNLTLVLLAKLRDLHAKKHQTTLQPLKVFVQLGTTIFDKNIVQARFRDSELAKFKFFKDPDSKNLTSVAQNFSIVLPPQEEVIPVRHLNTLFKEKKLTPQTVEKFFNEEICKEFYTQANDQKLPLPTTLPESLYNQEFAIVEKRQEMYAIMWEYVIFGTGKTIEWEEIGKAREDRISAMTTIALGWHTAMTTIEKNLSETTLV